MGGFPDAKGNRISGIAILADFIHTRTVSIGY